MVLIALIAILVGLPAVSLSSDTTTSPSGSSARPTLRLVAFDPVTVVGRGFKPRERVLLRADGFRKTVRASLTGTLRASVPLASTCGGVVVVARGSEGSRASVSAQFSNAHCLERDSQ